MLCITFPVNRIATVIKIKPTMETISIEMLFVENQALKCSSKIESLAPLRSVVKLPKVSMVKGVALKSFTSCKETPSLVSFSI